VRPRWMGYKSCIAAEIAAFLSYKRALSRKFDTEESVFRLLDRYLSACGVNDPVDITPSLLDAFLASRPRVRPRSYNHLLGVIRGFFFWMVQQGSLDCSPVLASPRRATARKALFLFGPAEAKTLLETAEHLPDNNAAILRGPTYSMIFALLYGLGLRVGEASRLCRKDVDLDRNLLVVRQTKFAKNRLVPFGPRMAERLSTYMDERGIMPPDAPLFSFGRGRPIHPCTISQTFHHVLPLLKLTIPPGTSPPRVHDLRHAFATRTLLRWYQSGVDPASRLMHLSTFLGHVSPSSTAVYLTITHDLLQEASARFQSLGATVLKGVTI